MWHVGRSANVGVHAALAHVSVFGVGLFGTVSIGLAGMEGLSLGVQSLHDHLLSLGLLLFGHLFSGGHKADNQEDSENGDLHVDEGL